MSESIYAKISRDRLMENIRGGLESVLAEATGNESPVRFTDELMAVNEADVTTTSNKYQRGIAVRRYADFLRRAGIEDSVRATTRITWDAWLLWLMRSEFSFSTAKSYCTHIRRLVRLWNETEGRRRGVAIDTGELRVPKDKIR